MEQLEDPELILPESANSIEEVLKKCARSGNPILPGDPYDNAEHNGGSPPIDDDHDPEVLEPVRFVDPQSQVSVNTANTAAHVSWGSGNNMSGSSLNDQVTPRNNIAWIVNEWAPGILDFARSGVLMNQHPPHSSRQDRQ